MAPSLLKTKLHIPTVRAEQVSRPRLIERLNAAIDRKLTLVSAPAGFGKTTLLSEWVHTPGGAFAPAAVAWLSLDEGDKDLSRFHAYLIAAVQTVEPDIGKAAMGLLQSPQPLPTEAVLTSLINDIAAIPDWIVLVLDDYHLAEARPIHDAFTFLLQHLPPQMHLVIATREDPPLPLARLRARGQLTELRVADLRLGSSEAAEFLNRVMGLDLSAEQVTALERRTEGWIAGLQLAAISMQGRKDPAGFIASFAGSHQFVMGYLLEEVLQQQSATVQAFLLRTSILDRLSGPLCDAVLADGASSGQETLEHLQQANLFIMALDDERHWYRYHRLFADLLRQRLHQQRSESVAELHIRASQWYEDNDLALEAFRHAAAANDVDRAARLMGGDGMAGEQGMPARQDLPLHFFGAVITILAWLASLPKEALGARPWLWWRYASLLLVNGQTTGVEEKLQAAEPALAAAAAAEEALQSGQPDTGPALPVWDMAEGRAVERWDDESRNLIGLIAAARATLALTRYDLESMRVQSRRALANLHPDSLSSRSSANWTLGYGYFLGGDRAAARQAFNEAVTISQAAGDTFTTILATIGLGSVQETDNELHRAADTYRRVLHLAGDQPLQIINEAYLGLARVLYEWNDLDGAEEQGTRGLELARQCERVIDRFVSNEVFRARLKLARGEVADAAAMLEEASEVVRRRGFVHRVPEVIAAQVRTLIRQGNLVAAAALAEEQELPLSQAKVHLARGDPAAALGVLVAWRGQVEAKGWADERLKAMVLQALALHALGEEETGIGLLGEALALAKSGGFVRLFVDEGPPMAHLLYEALSQGVEPEYVGQLLEAFRAPASEEAAPSQLPDRDSALIEPLSEREVEVLQRVAEGLTNQEIADKLYISVHTVRVHARNIYAKLGVKNRTEAVARGRALGILVST